MLSTTEKISWGFAVVVVIIMGVIALHGPFNKINKPAVASGFPTVQIVMLDNAKTLGEFKPANFALHLGQTAIFVNKSTAPHTATAYSGAFDSKNIALQASWAFTARTAGTFKYYCIYHPLMIGVLTVKA